MKEEDANYPHLQLPADVDKGATGQSNGPKPGLKKFRAVGR